MLPAELVKDWDKMVVLVAATSWDGVWQSERHLGARLADIVPILWVDPPISLLSPWKNPYERDTLRQPRLRQVAPNVLRLTPVTVPGHSRPGLRRIAHWHTRRLIRRCVAELGIPVHATIVASPSNMLDVVPARMSMLYGTDDWSAGAELMGLNRQWVERSEARQIRDADVVTAVSPTLCAKWSQFRADVVLVANGCDVERLSRADEAPLPSDVVLSRPTAGFIGHLSDRIDLEYLEAVADRGVSLLLVGPRQPTFEIGRIEALLARPNVQWVGAKSFEDLPSYLRVMDVGLTPYADSAFNQASFPLKTLEYLAAGRPVVATDLPATRWLNTDLVTTAKDPVDFASAVVEAVAAGWDAERVAERRAFATQHSWSSRAQQVAGLLRIPVGESAKTEEKP